MSSIPEEAIDEARRSALEGPVSLLPEDQRIRFVEQGIRLAGEPLRTNDPLADYFRVAHEVLPRLDDVGYAEWVGHVGKLASLASPIGSAFLNVTPAVLDRIRPEQIDEWAAVGEGIALSTWKSTTLASRFFDFSPLLLSHLTIDQLALLGKVIEGVADRNADLAVTCLEASPNFAQTYSDSEREAFLEFALGICRIPWPEAGQYFENASKLVQPIERGCRADFLRFVTLAGKQNRTQAYQLLTDCVGALRRVKPQYHGWLVARAGELLKHSEAAAVALLKSAPHVTLRLRPEELEEWYATGLALSNESARAGDAFFALQSSRSLETIAALTCGIELSDVISVLRLYNKALTGASLAIEPVDTLEDHGIVWGQGDGVFTDGTTVFLPRFAREFENKPDNFHAFKVYVTHQAGHIEFGSFRFRFSRQGAVLTTRRDKLERERLSASESTDGWVTDMERFFDLMPDRLLAADLFSIAEERRIDCRVPFEYKGLATLQVKVQRAELTHRPPVKSLPLREAFIEDLVRYSLDPTTILGWPLALLPALVRALHVLDVLRDPRAQVEDAAEATLLLYDLAAAIPNVASEATDSLPWASGAGEDLKQQAGSENVDRVLSTLQSCSSVEYKSPARVGYHGDFKPELVQLLGRLRREQPEDEIPPVPTADDISRILMRSVELMGRDGSSLVGQLVENLQREAAAESFGSEPDRESDEPQLVVEEPVESDEYEPEVHTLYYDEWDYRTQDYRPSWCAVHERPLEEGSADFYVRTLQEYGRLALETQRQFELLKPDNFRKLKYLEDGDDVDIDAVLDFVVQKKAGHAGGAKVYWRRNKVQRDVAVAFLMDMSKSTEDEVDKAIHLPGDVHDPQAFFTSGRLSGEAKRIIDLEKESLVLLTHALEVIGDRYAIYGFSGYGRENSEFFVIKELEEGFSDAVQRRIDKIEPVSGTRMGPAIRHATKKLLKCDAKARILFLVSDGRPQDSGYGRDDTDRRYAIHDTHQALLEAKRHGITPFVLTVDKEGHDYLGEMCGDLGYEVLGDIQLLPARLPALYRQLTA
ncbi:MAG: hypothetical protein GEU75_07070 [Dehalococcoidia bacterium]|nr:hypothetical protein [Dehalococcoidia bacterium]